MQVVEEVLLLEADDDQADEHLEALREDHGRGAVVDAVHHHHAGVAHGEDEEGVLEGKDHQTHVLQPRCIWEGAGGGMGNYRTTCK